MTTVFMIIAGLCIAVAAVFMFRGDFPTAFVVAVIGMLAWFLNYRSQMKALTAAEDSQPDESIGADSDENQ